MKNQELTLEIFSTSEYSLWLKNNGPLIHVGGIGWTCKNGKSSHSQSSRSYSVLIDTISNISRFYKDLTRIFVNYHRTLKPSTFPDPPYKV